MQFTSNSPVKTLRQTLIDIGVWIEGITSDSGFAMNGSKYSVALEKGSRPGLYYSAHTTEKDIKDPKIEIKAGYITLFNTVTVDDIHSLMFSALLQYDAQQFYGQLHKITKEQQKPQEQPYKIAA